MPFTPYVCERCGQHFPDVGEKLGHITQEHTIPLLAANGSARRAQWHEAWRVARRIASHSRGYSAAQRAIAILNTEPETFLSALACLRDRDCEPPEAT